MSRQTERGCKDEKCRTTRLKKKKTKKNSDLADLLAFESVSQLGHCSTKTKNITTKHAPLKRNEVEIGLLEEH